MIIRLRQAVDTQCNALYITSWKDLFPEKFYYPEKAVIRNKFLATSNKVLQIGILVFFTWLFFQDEQYMLTYDPDTIVKFWTSKGEYEEWEDKLLNGSAPDYCNNTDYNWVSPDDDYYQFVEASCVQPMFFEVFQAGDGSMFFLTYFHEATISLIPCLNFSVSECIGDYAQYYTSQDLLNKTCTCATVSNHFTVGVENITLQLEHEWSVPAFKMSGKSGQMVTIIRDYTGAEVVMPDGDISYNVGQWLEWAGVTLDDLNENADLTGEHPSVSNTTTYPRLRQTGVKVSLDLKYYNLKRFQPVYRGPATYAYVDISASLEWEFSGANVRYLDYPTLPREYRDKIETVYSDSMHLVNRFSYGVMFSISSSGQIGYFDWTELRSQMIDVLCMMGYVPVFVAVLASSAFGFKSEVYKGQLRHEMDGEQKRMEKFRKVFKYLFKNYWGPLSYQLSYEQFHSFCVDRKVPLEDEIGIREECIFQIPHQRGEATYLTAKMFFLALDDPDPDGKVDSWWEDWSEEYCHMKQVLYKKDLTNFAIGQHEFETDNKGDGDDDHSEEIIGWHETHKNIMAERKAKAAALEEELLKKELAEQEAVRKKAQARRAAIAKTSPSSANDVSTVKSGIEKLKRKHDIIEVKARQASIAIENLKIILKRDSRRIDRINSADTRYFKDFQRRLGSLESILNNQRGIAQFQRSSSTLSIRSSTRLSRASPRGSSIK